MFEQLVDIICNYVEIEQENIKPESRFMEDLGFTSFDFMSMLGEIEDEMDVEIEQDKAADIRTVGEAVAYLESLEQFAIFLQMQKNVLEMKTQSVTKQEKMKLRQRHTHS